MSFNDSYRGSPPWDIGRPQREFVNLSEAGEVTGKVIDVGCGTGEQAIFLSSKGHPALGVDSAPLAIEKAMAKAKARRSDARFLVADALDLGRVGGSFDTAVDCGLFHTFNDADRARYLSSLASVLPAGGKLFMLCFSDREPGTWGPRRVSKTEILGAFGSGWRVNYLQAARMETNLEQPEVRAYLTSATRL